MLDPKKFTPPIEVIQARREAILTAAREAQAHQKAESKTTSQLTASVPSGGFPIVLITANHSLTR